MKQQTAAVVDEQMIQIAKNLVAIRLEFESRAAEYHREATKLRRDSEKRLKKLEAQYYK